jgi:hypothetical protein
MMMGMVKNQNSENTGKLVAQTTNLVNLIDCQEGSIVSRTIIDKKTSFLNKKNIEPKRGD